MGSSFSGGNNQDIIEALIKVFGIEMGQDKAFLVSKVRTAFFWKTRHTRMPGLATFSLKERVSDIRFQRV
jgi:hypothetical protein